MDTLGELFTTVQAWLFETTLQPVMFAIGLGQLLAEGYDATGWLLLGLLQLLVLLVPTAAAGQGMRCVAGMLTWHEEVTWFTSPTKFITKGDTGALAISCGRGRGTHAHTHTHMCFIK